MWTSSNSRFDTTSTNPQKRQNTPATTSFTLLSSALLDTLSDGTNWDVVLRHLCSSRPKKIKGCFITSFMMSYVNDFTVTFYNVNDVNDVFS